MDFQAAIFDLDGTLLDSMGVWAKIDRDFLAKRGLAASEAYAKAVSARTFQDAAAYTIDFFHLDEQVEDLLREWNGMALHEYSHTVGLKPFAKEYLALLKSHGIKIGTATSLSRALSEVVLKNNGIYDCFDAQCFSDEVCRGKDFPDVFLLAAQRLQVPPERCVVFEDLLPGVISAKKAGMRVYGVYDEFSREQSHAIQKAADGYLYDFERAPLPDKRHSAR